MFDNLWNHQLGPRLAWQGAPRHRARWLQALGITKARVVRVVSIGPDFLVLPRAGAPSFIFFDIYFTLSPSQNSTPPQENCWTAAERGGTHHGNTRGDNGRWLQEYALISTSPPDLQTPPSPLLPLVHHPTQGSMCCRDDDAHEDPRGPPPNHGGGQRLGGGGGGGQKAFQGSGNTLGGGGE